MKINIFDLLGQSSGKTEPAESSGQTFTMPTVKASPRLFQAYAVIFKRDAASLHGFDEATISEMLSLISYGEYGYLDQGRYHSLIFDKYFKDRDWFWPEYDEWRAYFCARGEWPLGWPDDERTPRCEPLTASAKRRLYQVFMSTIEQRASSYEDERRQRKDGITEGSITTAYPENEAIIRDILTENPNARPPLFPYDVSIWTPTIPWWIDEPLEEIDKPSLPAGAQNDADQVYECPKCIGEIDPKAVICKWCGNKLRSDKTVLIVSVLSFFLITASCMLTSKAPDSLPPPAADKIQTPAPPSIPHAPFVVTMDTSISDGPMPRVKGTTNLPDGTPLFIRMLRPFPACYGKCMWDVPAESSEQGTVIVMGGKFSAGPDWRNDDYWPREDGLPGLRSGLHVLEIEMPSYALAVMDAPATARTIIGDKGENMRGPLINECCLGLRDRLGQAVLNDELVNQARAHREHGASMYYARYVDIP